MASLFSPKEKWYLGILYNNEPYGGSVEELFEPSSFDQIYVCTFVSSPKYFFTQTKPYKKTELLLGIEDSVNAQRFVFDPDFTSEFFSSLDKQSVEKIAKGQIEIRFTNIGTTIHSKIYIQKDSHSGRTRVMVGSANYSAKAFGSNNQYEELLVYDSDFNQPLCDYYMERYQKIREDTLDFVPKHMKKRLKKELKIITLNEEESLEILKERLEDIKAAVMVPDELGKKIENTKKILSLKESGIKRELESVIKSKDIIEIVTKGSNNQASFISPTQFAKKKEQIITKVIRPKKLVKEFEDSRIELVYSQIESAIYKKERESFTRFSKRSDVETIRQKLLLLEKFISAYDIYTVNSDKNTQKRIFEAILFAFLSPYMWRLREAAMWQQGREEVKSSFPLFMLIAGMAHSGKTHLIKFLSHIMGNRGSYYHYIKNSRLSSMSQINPQLVNRFFEKEILTPIFVDEINKEYFSSNSSSVSGYMGEGYIKNLTNSKEGRHPCMIATSNTDFSANPQIMRRIYYIQLNNPFDTAKKVETGDFFNEVLSSFGTDLFKDFLFRMEERFDSGIEVDINDILSPAREIFKEYYNMCGLGIPSFFSDSSLNDYYLRGRQMWKNLYNMKHTAFKEDRASNTILLDDEAVFGTKMSAGREKRELLQYLPVGVLLEEKGIVRLNREKFFSFIGQKSRNGGFFGRLFG